MHFFVRGEDRPGKILPAQALQSPGKALGEICVPVKILVAALYAAPLSFEDLKLGEILFRFSIPEKDRFLD